MITAPWQVGLLAALCLLTPGVLTQQNGGTLDCRRNGNTVTVELSIDHTVYPSVCQGNTDGKPIFQSNTNSMLPFPQTECTVKSDIRSAACSFTPSSSDPCGCTENTTSHFSVEYQFDYTPGKNDWYTATIQCTHPTLLTQLITFPTCELPNITITTTPTTPTETSPGTGTPQPSTTALAQKSCTLCDCGDDCVDGCVTCIILIIVIVVIIILIVVFFVIYCSFRHIKLPACCCGLQRMFGWLDACCGKSPPEGGCGETAVGPKDDKQNGTNNGAKNDCSGQPLTPYGAQPASAEASRPS